MGSRLNVGDAILNFYGNTSDLDQAFARIPAQTEAAMGAAAASVGGLGGAMQGVNFELDATAENVPYAGEVIKDVMSTATTSTREAKGEAALLGEMFGIHLPRHVRNWVAELPMVGTALSAAFSATAVLFLIEALAKGIEKLQEWSEHGEKVRVAWEGFNTSVLNSFSGLDDKLLETGIQLDNLRGNHLGALRKELELIDHQSMRDLVSEFDILAKASDAMFATLKASWLEFDAGSKGAQHALTDFKSQYDLLLAEGKGKEASDLLAGTLKSAQDTLRTMKEQNAAIDRSNVAMEQSNVNAGTMAAHFQRAAAHGSDELKAQEALIAALGAQVSAEKKINELKSERKEGKVIAEDNTEIKEQERVLQAGVKQEQAAIATEDKLREDARNKAIANLQEQEKEKIAATRQGSEAQLAAIEAAIKEEEAKGLQDTGFYKSLQEQKVKFHQAALVAQEKAENLAAAQAIVVAESRAKTETAKTVEGYDQQERAVTELGKFKILSATDVSKRLEVLYTAENKKLLTILNDLLKQEESAVKVAQAKLGAAQGNPLVSPQEIDELKKLLTQAEKAVNDTQAKIADTTTKFQAKQLSLDKGYYGQALAMAIASGQQEAAVKLKSTHDALLAAQAELVEAKARGQNTTAIDKEVAELKKLEKEQQKSIAGNSHMSKSTTDLMQVAQGAYTSMADSFATATNAMIAHQVSFGKAMVAAVLDMLAEIAKHYAKIYIAKGIGNLADMNWSAAALDFAAASAFEVLAGALTGMASNETAGAGKGSALSAQGQASSGGQSSSAMQAGGQPTASANVPRLFSGAIVTQPTMAMIGDGPNGGSRPEGVFPLDDPRAAQAINRLFGGEGTGGGIHNHFYVRGMLSTQDLAKTARIITRGAQTGRLRVSVANSARVTKRG